MQITYNQHFNGGPAYLSGDRTVTTTDVDETVLMPSVRGQAVYRLRRVEGRRVMRGSGYEYDFTGDYK